MQNIVNLVSMSKKYKWVNLTPDEIWEQTSPKVQKNKKKYNRKKLKQNEARKENGLWR